MRTVSRHEWRGAEHLPRSGGFVVVANHISHADPLPVADFLDAHGRVPRFLGKSELFDVPLLGTLLHSAGQIPVYRETQKAGAALSAAVAAVRRGECVVVYPEGTLTRDTDLWPMTGKTGAARIWRETGCPVVPVAQWGAHELLAPYAKVPHVWRRPVLHVWAGPPVPLGEPDEAADFPSVTAQIMAALTALLGRIRGTAPPDAPFDARASDLPRTGNPRKNHPGQRASRRSGEEQT
jgi:1-acyl-sn-glycerol-3-phosphate acyltransferase